MANKWILFIFDSFEKSMRKGFSDKLEFDSFDNAENYAKERKLEHYSIINKDYVLF